MCPATVEFRECEGEGEDIIRSSWHCKDVLRLLTACRCLPLEFSYFVAAMLLMAIKLSLKLRSFICPPSYAFSSTVLMLF